MTVRRKKDELLFPLVMSGVVGVWELLTFRYCSKIVLDKDLLFLSNQLR